MPVWIGVCADVLVGRRSRRVRTGWARQVIQDHPEHNVTVVFDILTAAPIQLHQRPQAVRLACTRAGWLPLHGEDFPRLQLPEV